MKTILYIILAITAVLLIASGIQKCTRSNKVQKLEERRRYTMALDSLKTQESNRRRVWLDSIARTYEGRYAQLDTVEREVVRYDTRVEIRYREKPTLANCDTVVASKNRRIGVLEEKDKVSSLLVRTKDGIIANRDSLIWRKDGTIQDLNSGYADATRRLERLGRRRVVISAGAGYGVGVDLKPQPMVGVTVGYKLFEF